MPKVNCSHCGEELMGSVNRCWRCGRVFVAQHNPENLPPIRRRPIPSNLVGARDDALALAEATRPVANQAGEGETGPASEEGAESPGAAIVDPPASTASEETRVAPGDIKPPGADEVHHAPVASAPPAALASHVAATIPYYAPAPAPTYPSNAGATGGAIASVVLGVMAFVALKFISPGALAISVLGVGMGVWGLHSDRRTLAVFGLLLCCIAMAASGFLSAVQIFEWVNGYNPFEPDLPAIEDVRL